MKQLRVAYPNLYVAFEQPVAVARFPASPLITIPERIAPVLAIGAGSDRDVRLERFAARFAGTEREDISPLQVARGQSIAGAIASTRVAWSEHNASLLEQDLGSTADPLSNQTQDLAWRLAQRVGVAMYEQASPQDAALRDWSALPWRFVKTFLDESVDDAARDRIAGFAQAELAAWLSGQKDWATAASEYADNVGAQLRDKAPPGRAARSQVAKTAVEHAAAEYAAARAELNDDVRRYAVTASAQRWQALEQSWMAGAAQLPPAPRDSAMKVLVRIRQMIDAQNLPLPRLALLSRIEEAWRAVVSPVASDEPDTTFANLAAAVIVGESLTLGSRRFADENRDALLKTMSEAAREHFGASIGREPKPSEGYKLDAYLQQMFTDSRALTAAALQRLSRNTDAAHRPLLLAASTKECEIAGNLTMSMLRDGWIEARSSRRLSIPCW